MELLNCTEPQAAPGPLNTNSTARGFVIASEDHVMNVTRLEKKRRGPLSFSKQMLPFHPAGSGVRNPSIKLVIKEGKSLQIFFNYLANSSDSSKYLAACVVPGKQEPKRKPGARPNSSSKEKGNDGRCLKKREQHVLQKGCPVLRLNCKSFHLFCNAPHRSSLSLQITNKFARSARFALSFFSFPKNNVTATTDNLARIAEIKVHETALPHPPSLGNGRCHSGDAAGACSYSRRHCSNFLRRASACRRSR